MRTFILFVAADVFQKRNPVIHNSRLTNVVTRKERQLGYPDASESFCISARILKYLLGGVLKVRQGDKWHQHEKLPDIFFTGSSEQKIISEGKPTLRHK